MFYFSSLALEQKILALESSTACNLGPLIEDSTWSIFPFPSLDMPL
jgi:hypothetical protein